MIHFRALHFVLDFQYRELGLLSKSFSDLSVYRDHIEEVGKAVHPGQS